MAEAANPTDSEVMLSLIWIFSINLVEQNAGAQQLRLARAHQKVVSKRASRCTSFFVAAPSVPAIDKSYRGFGRIQALRASQ
jgi:hypothetical protein